MAGAYPYPPIQNKGYQTSIELARQQSYSSKVLTGKKRPLDQEKQPVEPYITLRNSAGQAVISKPRQTIAPRKLAPGKIIPALPVESSTQQPQDATSLDHFFSEYSQREVAASTSKPVQNPLLSLTHPLYDLPASLISNFANLGIHEIYPWQSSCLVRKGVLTGTRNLIYTAPTGGGKSLVADLCLLRRIIDEPTKKGILVLPYVALVQEKLKWLRTVIEGVEKRTDEGCESVRPERGWGRNQKQIRLAGFHGGSSTKATFSDVDIAVCTIEKANSLVNTAIEECQIDKLGIIVVDELHMLNDENRGYLIELMITKLLCLPQHTQIIGMSATLSNPELLSDWIGGDSYRSAFRPVPVEEFLVYENCIYPTATSKDLFRTANQLNASARTQTSVAPRARIETTAHKELESPSTNAVVSLAIETAQNDYGVLVFCSSRQGSQNMAVLISEAMPLRADPDLVEKRLDVLASLQALPNSFEQTLSTTIIAGVGFHHRGLTTEEGEIICQAYDRGILKVIVATCSLAAGINLPARRVILHGARMGREMVGPAMFRQMRGRAGRKGKDEVGESYIVCQKPDLEAVAELLEAELPPTQSCLTPERRGMKRAILEVIATNLATLLPAIEDYVRRSLLIQTMPETQVLSMLSTTIDELVSAKMIQSKDGYTYQPSALGSATIAASLTPEDGVFVHADLHRAIQSFVMDGEMHIFYLFTPIQNALLPEISWPVFRTELEALDDSGLRVFNAIGINPSLVNRLVQSGASMPENTHEEILRARIYRRAYSAFQLRDLCNEVTVHRISIKYAVPRGHVQNLAQSCHGFAAGMVRFCQRMDWGMLAAVLEHMVDRLKAGARADLLEMAQVTYVKSRMARLLWGNGFKSIRALADAKSDDLVPVMLLAKPNAARLTGEALIKVKRKLSERAVVIIARASRIWERQQVVDLEE
ncbi:MAG: hypothetical protein Q9227_008533 [Pyrenula ochraceoflavens]